MGKFVLCWIKSNGVISCGATSVTFSGQRNLHIVMTVSTGDYARLYINGVLAGATAAVVSPLPPATAFYIGKSFESGNAGLIGSVNELRIWGGALSDADITTHYSQGPGDRTKK